MFLYLSQISINSFVDFFFYQFVVCKKKIHKFIYNGCKTIKIKQNKLVTKKFAA